MSSDEVQRRMAELEAKDGEAARSRGVMAMALNDMKLGQVLLTPNTATPQTEPNEEYN